MAMEMLIDSKFNSLHRVGPVCPLMLILPILKPRSKGSLTNLMPMEMAEFKSTSGPISMGSSMMKSLSKAFERSNDFIVCAFHQKIRKQSDSIIQKYH